MKIPALKLFERFTYVCAFVAAVLVLVLMLLVCLDVAFRILGYPVTWTTEINEYLLLAITFLGTTYVLRINRHVKVDIITSRLRPKTDAVFNVASSCIGIVISLVLIIFGSIVTLDFFLSGRTQYTILQIPSAPLYSFIPIGGFCLLAEFCRKLAGYLQKIK